MQRPKYPILAFLWLLLIPVQLVIDTILMSAAAYGDVSLADPDAPGHPAPALSILASLAVVVLTVIVIIASIILVIVRFVILNKRYNEYKNSVLRCTLNSPLRQTGTGTGEKASELNETTDEALKE